MARRQKIGVVVSNKMEKSIVIATRNGGGRAFYLDETTPSVSRC